MRDERQERLLGPLLEVASIGVGLLDADGRYLYVNERLAAINGLPVEAHLDRTLEEVIPHIAEAVRGFHERVMDTGEPVLDVQIRGSTPGMPDRIWQISYMPVEAGDERAVGAVLIDVTEREEAMAEASARVAQHAAVADLGQRALGGEPVSDLLDAACATLVAHLGADQAGVLEFAPGRDHLVMCSGAGFPPGAVGNVTADIGRGSQAGYTLLQDGPVLVPDLAAETRFEISEGMRQQGARSTISTPIPGAAEPYGVLGVFSRDIAGFDDDDASFVRAVANVLGAAVVREEQERALARLGEQRGRLVAQALDAGEQGQRQIADVLHDDVLQLLLFARQELSDARTDPSAIDRAQGSVGEAAALLRGVVAGLHPVTLAHAGLTAALESLAADHRGRAGLDILVEVDTDAGGPHDRLIVSLVRELLTNVAKHARAGRAHVLVAARDGGVEIAVADDGHGMPADALESALTHRNIGLATARERVEAVGGSVRVGAGIGGHGTEVAIRLPVG